MPIYCVNNSPKKTKIVEDLMGINSKNGTLPLPPLLSSSMNGYYWNNSFNNYNNYSNHHQQQQFQKQPTTINNNSNNNSSYLGNGNQILSISNHHHNHNGNGSMIINTKSSSSTSLIMALTRFKNSVRNMKETVLIPTRLNDLTYPNNDNCNTKLMIHPFHESMMGGEESLFKSRENIMVMNGCTSYHQHSNGNNHHNSSTVKRRFLNNNHNNNNTNGTEKNLFRFSQHNLFEQYKLLNIIDEILSSDAILTVSSPKHSFHNEYPLISSSSSVSILNRLDENEECDEYVDYVDEDDDDDDNNNNNNNNNNPNEDSKLNDRRHDSTNNNKIIENDDVDEDDNDYNHHHYLHHHSHHNGNNNGGGGGYLQQTKILNGKTRFWSNNGSPSELMTINEANDNDDTDSGDNHYHLNDNLKKIEGNNNNNNNIIADSSLLKIKERLEYHLRSLKNILGSMSQNAEFITQTYLDDIQCENRFDQKLKQYEQPNQSNIRHYYTSN